MRLIDADELLRHVKILGIIINNEDVFTDNIRSIISTLILAQPTAYDVDKIVEQLKKKAIPIADEDEHTVPESNVHEVYELEMVALSDAIEIVKAGGADGN